MKKPVFSIAAIVVFITPLLSSLIGLGFAWLFVHFHWLGVFHVSQSAATRATAGMVVFAITAVLHYAAMHFHGLPIVLENLRSRQAAKELGSAKTGAPSPTMASGTGVAQ